MSYLKDTRTVYEYYVPEFEEPEHAEEFKSDHAGSDDWNWKWTAEAICEERFCDWDYVCPEVIMLRRKGEAEWQPYSLEVETVPQFSAWKA